jgi:aryl-alcohol dehydrogenase-like predicted oxidoreductase
MPEKMRTDSEFYRRPVTIIRMRHIDVEGTRLSVIGLGTWQFGSAEWGYGQEYAGRTAGEIVRRALALGVNVLDTAEIYGFGRSERILGEALAGRRADAFLATKVLPVLPLPPVIVSRARGSARRLGTDRLDLYQIHWPNPAVPLGAQMSGLRRLLGSGLIGHAGVSNYSLDRWRRAESLLGRPVLTNQVRFNLLQSGPDHDLAPYARERGRVVIAYSPLAQGLLSGRWGPGKRPADRIRRFNPLFAERRLAAAEALGAELADVGRPHGATPSQVALAWLVRRPNVIAIPGASSVRQLEENAAAADLDLSDEDDVRLVAAAERFWKG